MTTQSDRRHLGKAILVILILSILADQVCSLLLPWERYLAGINPQFVFLDIPVPLPITMAILPVLGFFIIFYRIASSQERHSPDESVKMLARKQLRGIVALLLIIPVTMTSAGLLYYWVHDFLPRRLQNAVESFGVNEDLYLPIPGSSVIHYKGSMIIMGACWLGFYGVKKRIKRMEALSLLPVKPHPEKPLVKKPPTPQRPSSKKERPAKAVELIR